MSKKHLGQKNVRTKECKSEPVSSLFHFLTGKLWNSLPSYIFPSSSDLNTDKRILWLNCPTLFYCEHFLGERKLFCITFLASWPISFICEENIGTITRIQLKSGTLQLGIYNILEECGCGCYIDISRTCWITAWYTRYNATIMWRSILHLLFAFFFYV